MIRFFISFFALLTLFIITLPLTLLGMLIGLRHPSIQFKIGALLGFLAGKLLVGISGCRFHVHGQHHIPKHETLLFVGNHRSLFDIPLVVAYAKRQVAFIGKGTLKHVPCLNVWMVLMGCLFLDQVNLRSGVKTIKKGVQRLRDGQNLVIFPEGTRCLDANMLPFKPGSMKLALKSGTRVLPFAITGSDTYMESNGRFRLKPTHIHLVFHPPVDLLALDAQTQKQSAKYVQDIIKDLIDSIPKVPSHEK